MPGWLAYVPRSVKPSARLQAYLGPCSAWRWRYMLLRTYTVKLWEFCEEDGGAPLASDLDALRDIARDAQCTICERVRAQYFYALMLWAVGLREEARVTTALLWQLAAQATPEHSAQSMPRYMGTRSRWVTVGDLIAVDLAECKQNTACQLLHAKSATHVVAAHKQAHAVVGGIRWPVKHSSDAERAVHTTALRNALKDRSEACSHCGASAREGGGKLLRCGKCRLAAYCSPECQRAGWRVHRAQCRAEGEHEVGDVVNLHALGKRIDLNGQLVRVVGRDPHTAGRWLVESQAWAEGKPVSVRTECMQHLLSH